MDETGSRPDPTEDLDASTVEMRGDVLDPNVGKRIGNYHMKRVIDSGAMGTIYEALQEQPRRTVAVKVMNRGMTSRSALLRFERESVVAQQ